MIHTKLRELKQTDRVSHRNKFVIKASTNPEQFKQAYKQGFQMTLPLLYMQRRTKNFREQLE